MLDGFVLYFSFLEDFGCFPDPDLDFIGPLRPGLQDLISRMFCVVQKEEGCREEAL